MIQQLNYDLAEARCLGCGYQLRDLPEHRCPECGREFDPHDPATMRIPGWRHGRKKRIVHFRTEMLKLAAGASLFCIAASTIPDFEDARLAMLYGTWLWLVLFIACAIRPIWRIAFRSTGAPATASLQKIPRWVLAVTVLLMFCASAVRTGECPHASYYYLGSITLAHSGPRGPCWNVLRHRYNIADHWYFEVRWPE